MAKTIEELQLEIDNLKGLGDKNAQLLSELKKEKNKNREFNIDTHIKLQDDFDSLSNKFTIQSNDLKKSQDSLKESEDGFKSVSANYSNMVIDGEITNSLSKGNVQPGIVLQGALSLIRGKATLVDGKATIDGKSISDFVSTWLDGDGADYKLSRANHGGGGRSGVPTGTKGNINGTEAEKLAYVAEKYSKK